MYVKITNDQPVEFPYTIGQFRRDNHGTSFPKIIPDTMLKRHLVHPVIELSKPAYDPLVQDLVMDDMPHKEVIRLKTEEDATDPITGEVDQEQVGQPIYGNRWFIGWTVEDKPQDQAEQAVRNKRDELLSETDWMALSDNTLSTEMAEYRQALRDITGQEGFPYSVEWPIKPE
jgi:hypothetical protein